MESDVDHRRRPVEPQVERRHHAFHQMDDRGGVESEHDRLDSSVSLDVRAARTVGITSVTDESASSGSRGQEIGGQGVSLGTPSGTDDVRAEVRLPL
jgi:hypothetical protein